MMKNILNNILDFTGGEKFYRFGNADGKYWIMPARGMRTAMNLYQPSGIKGKMLRTLLPYLHSIPLVRKVLRAETRHCRLKRDFYTLLCDVFKTKDFEFAIFEGTPSASQKMIIQISRGKKLLGYCKITDEEDIYRFFRNESDNLNWLKEKNIYGIPEVLFCGKHSEQFLFIQSTKKSTDSFIPHEIGTLHIGFLERIRKATVIETPFEESDFYNDVQYLKSITTIVPQNDRIIFTQGIEHIEDFYKTRKNNYFSFFHGDFTPWNMYVEQNELFVFDFEFSEKKFPPHMDLLHCFLQILILEKKLCAEEIIPRLETFKKKNNICTTLVICYLVHILSFYFRLYNGKFDTSDNGYIIWSSLLKKQLNNTI